MNRSLAIIIISITAITSIAWTFCVAKKKQKKYEVSGSILFTHDYCGGARPSEEQVQPKPYPVIKGTTLYIRKPGDPKNSTVVIDSVVCDSAGNFNTKLAAGNYSLVEKWKTEPLVMPVDTKNEKWDTACYRQQYNQPDYSLNVKAKTSDVKIIIRRHCAWTRPCCSYRGPMPGGAPPVNGGGNQPGHQE